MEDIPSPPKLPKLPFILGSLPLFLFAGLILFLNASPISILAITSSLLFSLVGSLFLALPFIINFIGQLKITFYLQQLLYLEKKNKLTQDLNHLSDEFYNQIQKLDRLIIIFDNHLKQTTRKNLKDSTVIEFSPPTKEEQEIAHSLDTTEFEISLDPDDDLFDDHETTHPQGQSKIIVHTLTGIGSKLFIRGEGGGLKWDHGTPMEFVEVGTWQWTSEPTSTPIIYKIYKNDVTPAIGQNYAINPGEIQEIKPKFKG